MKNSRVGFFGGSFDPPHLGHIHLSQQIMSHCQLEEVWLCPAQVSPHKQGKTQTAVAHRIQMLKLAIENMKNLRVLDIESKRPGPSYTIDTLRLLIHEEEKKDHPRQICLILGEDMLEGFGSWREAHAIIDLVPILVGKRPGNFKKFPKDPLLTKALKESIYETDLMNISSSLLREHLNQKLSCEGLIAPKVLDYIYQNHLYLTGKS